MKRRTRSTEHQDFVRKFAQKLQRDGSIVYAGVPQPYWSDVEKRVVAGKIDLVAVKDRIVTAYELETSAGIQDKSKAKLLAFECRNAYIICHDGKAIKIK